MNLLPDPKTVEYFININNNLESKRFTIFKDETWHAECHIEVIDNKPIFWFHFNVLGKHTPANIKKMFEIWDAWREAEPIDLYTMATVDSAALDKLRLKYGFKKIGEVNCTDNNKRSVWLHSIKTISE